MTYTPMFPKPDSAKIQTSKNLCLGDPVKFKAAVEKFMKENREGLLRLGRE